MTVFYITKYALTEGIFQIEGEVSNTSERMVVDKFNKWGGIYHKPFWHRTKDEALAHAEQIRERKIANLKKQLTKIQNMTFSIIDPAT